MTDGRKLFDQHIKNYIKTHYNIRKIAIVQGDDYTAGCYSIILISKKTIS